MCSPEKVISTLVFVDLRDEAESNVRLCAPAPVSLKPTLFLFSSGLAGRLNDRVGRDVRLVEAGNIPPSRMLAQMLLEGSNNKFSNCWPDFF